MKEKVCTSCGESLPETEEFFYKAKPGQLRARCKKCQLKLRKEQRIAENERRESAIIDGDKKKCRECGKVKAITDFPRSPLSRDGRRYICRSCREAGAVSGKKKCVECGRLIESHLFLSQSGRVCVFCQPKLERKKVPDCIGPDWIRITATPRRARG